MMSDGKPNTGVKTVGLTRIVTLAAIVLMGLLLRVAASG